ncbi:M16 family metallopeptidase [Vibrio syngnathi]|uniref:Protease 3 n=1 Tax=Vibrio syngnathi TaxID=3034029 RepID=A0AA34XR86_9VIBR|nr:insulinase family protein [Vibrio syngnathi]ARP40983.1 Protease 3 precursor [Vibrio syngnathi]
MKTNYLATALCLTLVGCSSTSKTTETFIQPDPAWTSGQLENGFTYHVYPDHEAPVSVRLVVHAGSIQETRQQEGYAHFVEHMAFNGSKNFSQNDVIRLFEDAGASFGADINAYTSYEETVYQLDLPDNVQLQSALKWMRDIGDGLDLASSEVEKEKGVVLGEFRMARLDDKSFPEVFYDHFIEGSPYESQDALGTKESVVNATSQTLTDFYQTWYQPQIAELVVSGDVDIETVIPLIEAKFSSWQRGETPKPVKQKITTFNEGDYVEYTKREAPSISLTFNRGSNIIETHDQQHQRWLDETSQLLIQQRLEAVFNDAALPTQWIASDSLEMGALLYSSTSIGFPVGSREVTQQKMLSTLASLRDYGVSEAEIVGEQHYYQNLLDNIEHDWDKEDGVDHANNKASALVTGRIVQSQKDFQASMEAFISNVSLEAINDNIKSILSGDYFMIIGMNETENRAAINNSLDSLKATYSETGTAPLVASAGSAFAVPSSQGDIVLVEQISIDPYIQKWTLSNGIDMWYLRDSQANDDVGVMYMSLGGKAALDPSLYPAVEIALPTFARSGVGELTGSELHAYFDRENIQADSFIGSTRHGIEFNIQKDGLKDTFAALYTFITAPKINPEQLEAVKQEFVQGRESFLSSSVGQFERAINQNLYHLDGRHLFVDKERVEAVSVEDISHLHQQLFGQMRHNQLVIVGDIDPSVLKPLVQQYLASIPLEKAVVPDFKVAYKPSSESRIDLAINNVNSAEYILRVISEPSIEVKVSAKDVFMEDLLQRLLAARLDTYIREELSLDYSPYTYSASADSELSDEWVIGAMIAPENVDKVEVAIDKVITDLLQGVSEEEMRAVVKQFEADFTPLEMSSIDQAWYVSRYLLHGYDIEALSQVERVARSISTEDMNDRIQRVFGENSRKVKNIMRPKA